MSTLSLLLPYNLGSLEIKNRVVMAPLTRRRAGTQDEPLPMHVNYYQQRSGAGLIITEASQISPFGKGYPNTPGIYSETQINAWRKICHAVHAKGGKIFLQLWHVGRYSHPDLLPGGSLPVAPSPLKVSGWINVGAEKKETVVPKELSKDEIKSILKDYQIASENALKAGFDGVEIHGANGYLIDQFLQDGSNHRSDEYGGHIENRSRFLFEVIGTICDIWESGRVGLRLSPSGTKMDMSDSNSIKHFSYIINQLNNYNLAYLHLLEPWFDVSHLANYANQVAVYYRPFYKGTLIASGGLNKDTATELIDNGMADLVAFGKAFISNPDLVRRFELNAPLNDWDVDTFYGGDERGVSCFSFF